MEKSGYYLEEATQSLEMSQLECTSSILEQIRENMDEISTKTKEALKKDDSTSMMMVLYEIDRLANRHENLLILSGELIDQAESKIKKATESIYNCKEELNSEVIEQIEKTKVREK